MQSCRLVACVLSMLKQEIKPETTTNALNKLAEVLMISVGSCPAFKGYKGFPYAVCASVNHEVVHGFPNDNPLKSGDIVSIDFGVLHEGWYGDAAFTATVGEVSENASRLVKTTEECLRIGISKAVPYCRVGDISNAVQKHAEKNGFDVVKNYVGHGIGRYLHEKPQVPNFGNAGEGALLPPGTVIAIEPILVETGAETQVLNNNWTVAAKNGELSAHFEHTVAITASGPVVLTDFE